MSVLSDDPIIQSNLRRLSEAITRHPQLAVLFYNEQCKDCQAFYVGQVGGALNETTIEHNLLWQELSRRGMAVTIVRVGSYEQWKDPQNPFRHPPYGISFIPCALFYRQGRLVGRWAQSFDGAEPERVIVARRDFSMAIDSFLVTPALRPASEAGPSAANKC